MYTSLLYSEKLLRSFVEILAVKYTERTREEEVSNCFYNHPATPKTLYPRKPFYFPKFLQEYCILLTKKFVEQSHFPETNWLCCMVACFVLTAKFYDDNYCENESEIKIIINAVFDTLEEIEDIFVPLFVVFQKSNILVTPKCIRYAEWNILEFFEYNIFGMSKLVIYPFEV